MQSVRVLVITRVGSEWGALCQGRESQVVSLPRVFPIFLGVSTYISGRGVLITLVPHKVEELVLAPVKLIASERQQNCRIKGISPKLCC